MKIIFSSVVASFSFFILPIFSHSFFFLFFFLFFFSPLFFFLHIFFVCNSFFVLLLLLHFLSSFLSFFFLSFFLGLFFFFLSFFYFFFFVIKIFIFSHCFLPRRLWWYNTPTVSLQKCKTTPNECPGNYTKQSEGEIPVMLELWGMQSTPSLPSFPGPLWPGVEAPDWFLSMDPIELNCVLMLN